MRGIASVDLVASQDVGLAAEPADAFDPADEACLVGGLDPRQLLLGRSVSEELPQFLVQRDLHRREVPSGLRRPLHNELSGDLAGVHVR